MCHVPSSSHAATGLLAAAEGMLGSRNDPASELHIQPALYTTLLLYEDSEE